LAGPSTASLQIYHADPVWPVPGKYDIKDGFYRMMIRARDALASPSSSPNMREEQMVAVPVLTGLDQRPSLSVRYVGDGVRHCECAPVQASLTSHRLEHLASTHDAILPQ
jgi:hypothetical protein